MSRRRIEVRRNRRGRWFWHEIAGNGEITAVAQPYSKKGNAVRGARRAAALAGGLRVLIIEPA